MLSNFVNSGLTKPETIVSSCHPSDTASLKAFQVGLLVGSSGITLMTLCFVGLGGRVSDRKHPRSGKVPNRHCFGKTSHRPHSSGGY